MYEEIYNSTVIKKKWKKIFIHFSRWNIIIYLFILW